MDNTQRPSRSFYLHEDDPFYKHAIIIPYHHDSTSGQTNIYLKRKTDS